MVIINVVIPALQTERSLSALLMGDPFLRSLPISLTEC